MIQIPSKKICISSPMNTTQFLKKKKKKRERKMIPFSLQAYMLYTNLGKYIVGYHEWSAIHGVMLIIVG